MDRMMQQVLRIDPATLDPCNYFATLVVEAVRAGALDSGRARALEAQVPVALERLIGCYNNGRSSSISVEGAQSLLCSLTYTLDVALLCCGGVTQALELLRAWEVDALWERGRRELDKLIQRARALHCAARKTCPPWGSDALRHTLTGGIEMFFGAYNADFAAHETPADISCFPAVDNCPHGGVLYLGAFLRTICLENRFCALFSREAVQALLRQHRAVWGLDFRHTVESGCLLLAQSAAACLLAGRPPGALVLSAGESRELLAWGAGAQPAALDAALEKAGRGLAAMAGEHWVLRGYLEQCWRLLRPRFHTALTGGAADGLFPGLEQGRPPGPVLAAGAKLADQALRDLVRQVMDRPDVEGKLELILSATQRMEDFVDVLRANCLFGDEYGALYTRLSDMELTLLAEAVFDGGNLVLPDHDLWQRALLEELASRENRQGR